MHALFRHWLALIFVSRIAKIKRLRISFVYRFKKTATWVNISTEGIVKYFFSFFPENTFWHFMQIVSNGDTCMKCHILFSGKIRSIVYRLLNLSREWKKCSNLSVPLFIQITDILLVERIRYYCQALSSRHNTLKRRRFNVESTLFQRCVTEKGSTLKWKNFFFFRIDPCLDGAWCAGKQRRSHKSCLPCNMMENLPGY